MPTYRAWLRSTNRAAVLTWDELVKHLRRGNVVQVSEIGQKQPIVNPPLVVKATAPVSRNGMSRQESGAYRHEWTKRGRR